MEPLWLIDRTLPVPEANLAYDEALLNFAEECEGPDTLRFWESSTPFIVLGVAQPVAAHVNQPACAADSIPILRRCSAGGCVVQGPGSLNYALVLNNILVKPKTRLFNWKLFLIVMTFHVQSLKIP